MFIISVRLHFQLSYLLQWLLEFRANSQSAANEMKTIYDLFFGVVWPIVLRNLYSCLQSTMKMFCF